LAGLGLIARRRQRPGRRPPGVRPATV
jgi:hypothetical protein